jgi:hypothetical protein
MWKVLLILLGMVLAGCGDNQQNVETSQDSTTLNSYEKPIKNVVELKGSIVEEDKYSFEQISLLRNRDIYTINGVDVDMGSLYIVRELSTDQAIIVSIDLNSTFDELERSQNFVMRHSISSVYPLGYLNINLSSSSKKISFGEIIEDIINTFQKHSIHNPKLQETTLLYTLASTIDRELMCNNTKIILKRNQNSLELPFDINQTIQCDLNGLVVVEFIVQDNKTDNNMSMNIEDNSTIKSDINESKSDPIETKNNATDSYVENKYTSGGANDSSENNSDNNEEETNTTAPIEDNITIESNTTSQELNTTDSIESNQSSIQVESNTSISDDNITVEERNTTTTDENKTSPREENVTIIEQSSKSKESNSSSTNDINNTSQENIDNNETQTQEDNQSCAIVDTHPDFVIAKDHLIRDVIQSFDSLTIKVTTSGKVNQTSQSTDAIYGVIDGNETKGVFKLNTHYLDSSLFVVKVYRDAQLVAISDELISDNHIPINFGSLNSCEEN